MASMACSQGTTGHRRFGGALQTAPALVAGVICAVGLGARPAGAIDVFLQGSESGGRFGAAVADAGDVNNDGLLDLIVGAPLDDTLGLAAGRAFLWLGGSSLTAAPRLVFTDGLGDDRFGFAVAGIGDVNNDGFDDVAVGAPSNDDAGSDAGAVFIYYGGPTAALNAVFDRKLTGETGDDLFGWSVEKAGDMNDDGRPDFVVGAPFADPVGVGTDAGAVYLYLGANGNPSTAFAVRFQGAIAGERFGWDVADVPNFKGDGQAAIAVGAPANSQDGLNAGRAYLFFAGQNNALPNTAVDVTFKGFPSNPANARFGFAVSQCGAFNTADSRSDLAIGGPGYQGGTGALRVFYGESAPADTLAHDLLILGDTAGDSLGAALADVGNHNGTGPGDLVVGAPARDANGAESGQAYLVPGGFTGSSITAAQVVALAPGNPFGSGTAGDHFGAAISWAGDLDGDGRGDFLLGAPDGNVASGSIAGIVAIVSSTGGVVPVPIVRMTGRMTGATWELVFDGPAADAVDAQLFTVGAQPRLLAELGRGIEPATAGLLARVPAGALVGVAQVELRWVGAGVAHADRFAVPQTPATRLRLQPPTPNPFNPSTVIRFELAVHGPFAVRILDPRGRLVRTLEEGVAGPGPLESVFDGRDDTGRMLASGAYTVVLEAAGQRRVTPAVLVK